MIPVSDFHHYVTSHGLTKCDITEINANEYNEYDDLNHVIIIIAHTNRVFAIDITSGC